MDETSPQITFDSINGYCNYCIEYYVTAKKALKPYSQLKGIINKIKKERRNEDYDCLIGISGGFDSSYTAYLTHSLGLRALLTHFDNGYDAHEGLHNIKSIIENTGWDYEYRTMNQNEFVDLQLAYLKSGVKNFEVISDHAIKTSVYEVAVEFGIPYMIKGNNWVTEGILPSSWGYRHTDLTNIKDIHRKHGNIPLNTFPQMSVLKWIWRDKIQGVKHITPLNFINYNWSKAKKILSKEWGIIDYGQKHGESIITRFYQGYILPLRWGYDKRKAHLSTRICSGQITREKALKELKETIYDPEHLREDYRFVLNKLGLTGEEFNQLMKLPLANHSDYKTNDLTWKLLRYIIRISRKLGVVK